MSTSTEERYRDLWMENREYTLTDSECDRLTAAMWSRLDITGPTL